MNSIVQSIIKRFMESKAKYIRIDLGWRKYIEIEKTEMKNKIVLNTKSSSKEETESNIEIQSFYVGLFKLNPEIKKEKTVKKGQLLGSIESVGISHEVISPVDGVIEEIYVKDKDIVEYGQKLFLISEGK